MDENKSEIVEEVVKKKKGFNKAIKVFGVILIIVICLSIAFGLTVVLLPFLDDCEGISRGSVIENTPIEERVVKPEYREKSFNFCEDFNSPEDVLNYILQGEVDTLGMPENFQYFEADMIDFENYLVKKGFCFRYNTLFVMVKGYYTPLIHFTPEIIYFDIDTFNNAKAGDSSEVLEKWLNFCLSMGYSDKEIEDFLSKFQDLDNSIIQLMLQIPFGANTVDLKKPVIYLYPEKRTDISLTVEGVNLTTTYPNYNNGWNVTAYPDGTLIDDNGRGYNYLYWEGKSNNFEVELLEGFVVSKNNYIEFLEEKLDYVGLTNKESADFISYWLPYMNEYEYCQVSFQMENYEEQVKLDFSVKPDNELRVFVAFKGLDKPIEIEEQDLSYYNGFERTGFTVVEWGGTIIE